MYEKHNRICIALFLFCIFASLFSPKTPEQVQAKSIPVETKTQTWKVEKWLSKPHTQTWTSTISNKEEWRKECDSICKSLELQRLWIRKEIADSLIVNCKAIASDPRKCVIVWASIVVNESSWGLHCRKNNKYSCFWIMWKQNYKSYDDATLHFVWKFERWWYKANDMSFFYSKSWTLPPSRFCISEDSSWSAVWCPNWLKNSSAVFNSLNNFF